MRMRTVWHVVVHPASGANDPHRDEGSSLRPAGSVPRWALPRLGDAEFRRVLAAYEWSGDPHLRDAIVDAFLPVVRGAARECCGVQPERVERAMCAGVVSVLRAIDEFDWHGRRSFGRYCTAQVRAAVRAVVS